MHVEFEPYHRSEILHGHLHLGGSNPGGERIEVNSLCLTRGGQPWLPVMGEFHFSRCDPAQWQTELCKMKAGGVTMVSTYLFWIHHEEREGELRFSGRLDVRRFVLCCRRAGLDVVLRIGPWAHGECRNGGFPDWLLHKGIPLRQNHPAYLALVRAWYRSIYRQVRGLLYRDGGPIVGIQLENELVDNSDHLAALKRIAVEEGFEVPLYTVTGWNAVSGARIPTAEVLPVFAAYWNHVRRALLRAPIDRIGLGGYLHLVKDFPDFVQYIADLADEFREVRDLHAAGEVYTMPLTVAVLHSWGGLRPWTLSGHFHETYMHDLIHINEALSGLPVETRFLSFEDVKAGKLEGVDVVINAGRAGTAWSGGDAWQDAALVTALSAWVAQGGVLIGVNEPTAVPGWGDYFRMARALGVDEDTGARVCHGRWPVQADLVEGLIPEGATLCTRDHLYLTDGETRVLAEQDGCPAIATHTFGRGRGIYLAGFAYSPENARMLLNLMLWATGTDSSRVPYLTDNAACECAWFPAARRLVVINNTEQAQTTVIHTPEGDVRAELAPFATRMIQR